MDYASSAPTDGRVISLMAKSMKIHFANPSALHVLGVEARKVIQKARKEIADILHVHSDEIIFTSSGTESINLALLGLVRPEIKKMKERNERPHVVTTNIEHSAILSACKKLESEGVDVIYVEADKDGFIDPKQIENALNDRTVLVSVMYANNEIGTVQNIYEIAKSIRHFKKMRLGKDSKADLEFPFFHTDATQAMNYLPINVQKLGIDMLTFNGAKIYGPKGIAVLYKKRNINLEPIIFGGAQENNLRAGTENLPAILGISLALQITEKMKDKEYERLKQLQEYFWGQIEKEIPNVIANGSRKNRLPNNINISVPKIPSDLLLLELDARGIYASSKSACKSSDTEESYVLKAIAPDRNLEEGTVRLSMGRRTTRKEIDIVVLELKKVINKLSPWY